MIQPFCKRKLLSVIKAVVDIRNADARIQTGNLIKRKQMSQGKGVGAAVNNTENRSQMWPRARPGCLPSTRATGDAWEQDTARFRKGKWSPGFTAACCTQPLQAELGSSLEKQCFFVSEDNRAQFAHCPASHFPCFLIRCFPASLHSSLTNWL